MDVETAERHVLNFGKHKGKKLTDVPVSYLRYIAKQVCTGQATAVEAAETLLSDRGITSSTVYLTFHAIDRFSQRGGVALWTHRANRAQGFAAFLRKLAVAAMEAHIADYGRTLNRQVIKVPLGQHTYVFRVSSGAWHLTTVLDLGSEEID